MRMGLRSLRPMDLIRLMVGSVFLSEGVQKFLFPAELGVGRFLRIGIPFAKGMAPFVGGVEVAGGLLLLLDVLTLWAALALLANISVAILSTKLPILLGRPVGPFALPKLPSYGVWPFLHEARTDGCMVLGCLAIALWKRRETLGGRGRPGPEPGD